MDLLDELKKQEDESYKNLSDIRNGLQNELSVRKKEIKVINEKLEIVYKAFNEMQKYYEIVQKYSQNSK